MSNPTPARVLVVDDEPLGRDVCRRLLERDGYDVRTADGGVAALNAMTGPPPDVVLLDVNMPGLDGFAVCRAIKVNPATRFTPVIIVTGAGDRAHRLRGIDAGADDFLSKPVDGDELRARVRSLVRLKRSTDDLESAESLITTLALTIEARDSWTSGHSLRVAGLAMALGRRLGLAPAELAVLERGGLLHDIGKVAVPDNILSKPGPLTDAEFIAVQQHTVIGERLCGTLRTLAPVRSIVRSHHERRDGSGYPDRIAGDAVPLHAEIVGIADVYDAITSHRPYRRARSPRVALETLAAEARRGLWRPDLVDAFIQPGVIDVLESVI